MKPYLEAKNATELCDLLGLPKSDAPKIELKTQIVLAIIKHVKKNNLTHTEVSQKTGIGRTVITAIVNGNLKSISTDRLIDIATRLGLKMKLKVA